MAGEAAFVTRCGVDISDVPRDLAEAALAYSLNATEGAYRRMTAVERRRGVMETYSRWLNDEGADVVTSCHSPLPNRTTGRLVEIPIGGCRKAVAEHSQKQPSHQMNWRFAEGERRGCRLPKPPRS